MARAFLWFSVFLLANASDKSAMVSSKFSASDLSNKYFISEEADLPAPIISIFLILL